MPIITIAHAAFSGGNAIADKVASSLGYRSVDREVLIEASKRYGIPEAKYDEVLEQGGRWWERWVESVRLYRITLQAAMCEMAQGGNLVYHGRAGQELFPGVAHVLKVLIVAPMEDRIAAARSQRNLDLNSAKQYLRELDRVRSRRFRALFNEDWQDPLGHDLVINRASLNIDSAAALIVDASRLGEFRESAESQKKFADLTTTARVQAALIINTRTRNIVLNVASDSGKVKISGILADPELEKEVVRVAQAVPGVADIATDIEAPPIEYMHP